MRGKLIQWDGLSCILILFLMRFSTPMEVWIEKTQVPCCQKKGWALGQDSWNWVRSFAGLLLPQHNQLKEFGWECLAPFSLFYPRYRLITCCIIDYRSSGNWANNSLHQPELATNLLHVQIIAFSWIYYLHAIVLPPLLDLHIMWFTCHFGFFNMLVWIGTQHRLMEVLLHWLPKEVPCHK